MSSAFLSNPISSIAWGVGSMPDEVRTNRGSLKCLRSFARLMLIADWLRSRFSAVCDTLLVLCSSVTTASSFRSILVTSETPGLPQVPQTLESAYHRNACIPPPGKGARVTRRPEDFARELCGLERRQARARKTQCMHSNALLSAALMRAIRQIRFAVAREQCYCFAASFEDPANSRLPSGNVTLLTFAVAEPLRACQPSTTSTVPAGRSPFRQPRRINAFADPVSSAQVTTLPSVSTSR